MEINSIFIEEPCWSDIHDKPDFIIIILCAGQGSSVIDFVNWQNAYNLK